MNDPVRQARLFSRTVMATLAISLPILVALAAFGDPILKLWLGDVPDRTYSIMIALGFVTALELPGHQCFIFLTGIGRNQLMMRMAVVGARSTWPAASPSPSCSVPSARPSGRCRRSWSSTSPCCPSSCAATSRCPSAATSRTRWCPVLPAVAVAGAVAVGDPVAGTRPRRPGHPRGGVRALVSAAAVVLAAFQLKPASGGVSSDQLSVIVDLLRADPDSRRALLQIWDAEADLGVNSRDLACNTQAMFKVRGGRLNMTISNRSNDIVWGCYGANAVQFSMLLEYMAARIGVEPGIYRQVSDSYHAYHDTWPKISDIAARFRGDPYVQGEVSVYPLVADPSHFDAELVRWFENPPDDLSFAQWEAEAGLWRNPYFIRVATPVHNSWLAYKRKDREAASQWLDRCAATDWQRAAREWLQRRSLS